MKTEKLNNREQKIEWNLRENIHVNNDHDLCLFARLR